MILIIDNYDSFTYNLADYFQNLGQETLVVRNDKLTINDIININPNYLVLSPGPGRPEDAGITIKAIEYFAGRIPILGVCLGHQAIVQFFGGNIIQAKNIVHGKIEQMSHDERGMFRNIKQSFVATRYHSLAADAANIPDCLEITATSVKDGEIMGVRHKEYLIEGLQFHPESIGTTEGIKLLNNFLNYNRELPQKHTIMSRVIQNIDLSYEESITIMEEIMAGELTESQLGGFLCALNVKGVTAEELSAFANVLRNKVNPEVKLSGLLDTCGTGGDNLHTFNISTAGSLVCASLGVPVAKHGNRAVSSTSGSYDFLKALGIQTEGNASENLKQLQTKSFAFYFAPLYHTAMKNVAKVRQELKLRTVFNLLGPLINPMGADYQLTGIYSHELLDLYIETLKKLNLKKAMVVNSEEGLDEISISAETNVRELNNGEISSYKIKPEDYGFKRYELSLIRGGTAHENAQTFMEIIAGIDLNERKQAIKESIAVNAGAGLYVAEKAKNLIEGYNLAKEHLDGGEISRYIEKLRQ